jgi:hypothetical protein
MRDKEFFLNLVDDLDNLCKYTHEVGYHYRYEELLKARDTLIKECLITIGLIEVKGNQ